MKNKTRLLGLLLAFVLIVPSFASAIELSAAGELPIAKEPTKLTVLMPAETIVQDYETNDFTLYIQEQTNVDLDFELLPSVSSEAQNKLAVMIASGQKLPDVLNMGLSIDTAYSYAMAGAFIPLNDYIQSVGVNMMAREAEYPDFKVMENSTCPDGNIYAVPAVVKELHNETKYKLWTNRVWLETLGLEVPQTTDELADLLRAFKEKDPNGNGLADEYPLVGGTGWSQDPTIYLMNAFVYDGDGDRILKDADGKLSVA
ncbi:MAG TPA: extracellular solute-binding protein, partial [Clostridia bacterium]|nr:extracellular solute-binding protein [Clostridia bacterium]